MIVKLLALWLLTNVVFVGLLVWSAYLARKIKERRRVAGARWDGNRMGRSLNEHNDLRF